MTRHGLICLAMNRLKQASNQPTNYIPPWTFGLFSILSEMNKIIAVSIVDMLYYVFMWMICAFL